MAVPKERHGRGGGFPSLSSPPAQARSQKSKGELRTRGSGGKGGLLLLSPPRMQNSQGLKTACVVTAAHVQNPSKRHREGKRDVERHSWMKKPTQTCTSSIGKEQFYWGGGRLVLLSTHFSTDILYAPLAKQSRQNPTAA